MTCPMSNLVQLYRFQKDVMERKIYCHVCGFYQTMYLPRNMTSEKMDCPNKHCHGEKSIWFVDTRK